MKKTKTKLLTLCGVLAIGASLLGSTQVYAYENGQNDPRAATNTLEVKKTDSATISAEGTFEPFDPTKLPDPAKPTPKKDHKAWVDVKIPSKVLFSQTDVSEGIISPNYEIQNLSAKGVKVSINDFTDGDNANKLEGRLDLNLNSDGKKVALRSTDKQKAPSFPTEIGTITSQNGKIQFTLAGSVKKGFDFTKETVKANYKLVLKFEVQ